MRYLFILLSLFCFLFISFSGQAKPKNNIIKLYTKPSTRASVVTKINPLKNLVPIYQKGAWVKVGDPENGDVGWININEYQSAVRKLTGTQEKTLYLQYVNKPNNKKPTLIVYENGKKLSKKRALDVYKHMQKQETEEQDQFHKIQLQMEDMQHQMNKAFKNFSTMNYIDDNPSLTTPMMIVVPSRENTKH